MRNRRTILPLALCLLLTSCATVEEYASPSPAPSGGTGIEDTQATPVPAPQWGEQIYQTSFTAEGRQRPVFSPEYRLPKILNAEGVPAYEAINSYYEEALASLASAAAETSGWAIEDYNMSTSSDFPFYEYVDTERYVISLETAARVCILRTHTNSAGSPSTVRYPVGEVFDLTTGARLYLADLVSCTEEEAQERILSAVIAINGSAGYNGSPLDEEALRGAYHPERFYLTEDSFVVYYPAGDIAGTTDSPTYAIPYTELEDILTPWE